MNATAPARNGGLKLSIEDRLGFHVKQAETVLNLRKTEALRAFDLTLPQYCVLSFLLEGLPKSCTQLARDAHVTPQTMTGVSSNLEAKGLIRRSPSADHARVQLLSLTDAGAKLGRAADEVVSDLEIRLLDAFSESEQRTLVRLLGRITEVLGSSHDGE